MIKNNKSFWKELFVVLFIFVLAIIFLFNSPCNILNNGVTATDSSVFRLIAMLMSKGYMPYLDTFDHKGPLLFIINFFGYIINNNYGFWIIEIIFMFLSFLFIYKIARFQNKIIPSLIVLLFSVANLFSYFGEGNFTEEYALVFILISLYIFIDYLLNNKISKFRIIICGACFACVCLLRINMIPCWVVFCIVILIKTLKDREYKKLASYIVNFIIGSCIIILPIFAWLFSKGAFSAFINDYFLFNFQYTRDAGLYKVWNTFFSFINNVILIIVVLANIYAITKEKNKTIYIANLSFIILTLFVISMSGRTYAHYAMILIPTFVIPLSYLFKLIITNNNKDLSVVIIMYLLATLVIPNWEVSFEKIGHYYSNKNNNTSTIPEDILSIKKIIEDNSSKDDKIIVYGNWDYIYIISNRLPASKYSYQFPLININPKISDEFFDEIKKEKPKIIVIHSGLYDKKIKKFINKYGYKKLWNKDNDIFIFKI